MQKTNLIKIKEYCSAELLQGKIDKNIDEIVIDSREVQNNYLFIAIIGENQDGHKYINEAAVNGASAVIVDREISELNLNNSDLTVLKVDNTTRALQAIAHNYRLEFDDLKVIAITGSAGKTTTKDLIYSVLSQRYNCLKTEGNYNNHIGLPLTLLKLKDDEKYAVLEMGMSDFGEIDLLAKIAVPDFALVTNVAAAHLKQLGSLENIARAKKELIDNLNSDDTAILNYDNKFTRRMAPPHLKNVIYFGFEDGADLQCLNFNFNSENKILDFKINYKNTNYNFILNKAGKHNIYNAMAAIALGFKNNLSKAEIQKGLLNANFSALRMEFVELNSGAVLINDSYNANPLAVKAALDVLEDLQGERKIAVLASMLELGSQSRKKHKEIGRYAAQMDIDLLITVGSKAKFIAEGAGALLNKRDIISFADNQQCINYLGGEIKNGDLVLIKGSRGNKLEEIVFALKDK